MSISVLDDDRADAERLKLVSHEDQLAIIALHRSVAANAKAPKAERQESGRKADALEKLLGLKPK